MWRKKARRGGPSARGRRGNSSGVNGVAVKCTQALSEAPRLPPKFPLEPLLAMDPVSLCVRLVMRCMARSGASNEVLLDLEHGLRQRVTTSFDYGPLGAVLRMGSGRRAVVRSRETTESCYCTRYPRDWNSQNLHPTRPNHGERHHPLLPSLPTEPQSRSGAPIASRFPPT